MRRQHLKTDKEHYLCRCGIEEIWVENVFEWYKGSSRSTIIDELFKREEEDDDDGRVRVCFCSVVE